MTNILAIDPGGTTGIAVRVGEWLNTCVMKSPEEVFDLLQQHKDVLNVVVIENFAAQDISKYGLHTVRIVGGVYALCYINKIEYVLHTPQDRYPFKEESKQWLETSKRGKGIRYMVHELDALAHLFRLEYDRRNK